MGSLRRLFNRGGTPAEPEATIPLDATISDSDRRILERATPYTMTGQARLQAVIDAARHCQRRGTPGAFAECGVWRGGSVLAMVLALQEEGCADRDIYLYDTFEGMTRPTDADVSPLGGSALSAWQQDRPEGPLWPEVFGEDVFSEETVRSTVLATGYPEERVHLVRGPVEETIPGTVPERLALLRLDTDWYESTRHELEHLYPRLVEGGVLIIDDYGHWDGCRRAVDEYFAEDAEPILLSRIDYTGRIGIKH